MLRESAKVYNPLRLPSPIMICAKIFIQELWERGFEWDEPLQDDKQKLWFDVSQDLADSTRIQVPRIYFPIVRSWPSDAVLHVFLEASIDAYGTVVYLTSGPRTNNGHVQIVACRSAEKVNIATTRTDGSCRWSKTSILSTQPV